MARRPHRPPTGLRPNRRRSIRFFPATAAAKIAPRPILFIHSRRDPVIDFDLGRSLFESASAPKSFLWLDDMTDDQAINDPNVASRTLRFLDTAVPML